MSMAIIFIFNIYGYKVQAIANNSLAANGEIDKSVAKSHIMNNYKSNKVKKNFKADEIIVKAKVSTNNASIQSTKNKYSLKSKKKLDKQLDVIKFDSNKYSMDEILLSLNQDANIEYAEPNYIRKVSGSPENEPGFINMWGLNNTTTKGVDINVEAAWKVSTGNPNLVVGVIDTGIDYSHEDLENNIWTNNAEIPDNGKDDDGNGYVDDVNGWNFAYGSNDPYDDNDHGTHVSGTIAAPANGIGIAGVAPTVKIMPLKTADAEGTSYDSDIVSAIQYGVSKGVKLFNCSFGGDGFSQAEYDVMKSSNALFMCAAGNGDDNNNGLDTDGSIKNYPSSFDLPNIISVASIDEDGALSSFSNYGMTSVDIAAPGDSIYSTVPGGYAYYSGTSMATPHVTGVAALVLSENMNLSPSEVKNCILKSTNKLSSLANKTVTGAIVDAFGAMVVAKPSILVNVTGVQIDNSSINLLSGASKQLVATITPSNATNKSINWTSSNSSVVTVDGTGKVKAIGAGAAVIIATTAEGNKTSTCNVTVTKPANDTYYPGDTFRLKIKTLSVSGNYGWVYMIKPDGTEKTYFLQWDASELCYYVELSVSDGGIDSTRDFGTWEVKDALVYNVDGSSTYYYNEKYYSVNTETKKTLNFDKSKFTIISPDGTIKDNTNDLSNNSKMTTPGDVTLFKSVETTKKKVYPGDNFIIKINAKDTSGIKGGAINFLKQDGTEVSYSLITSPRGGYYYVQLEVNNGGNGNSGEGQLINDFGLWKIKSIALTDVNDNYTNYNSDTNLDSGSFTVYNAVKPIIPTDVDDNGVIDIIDLALVSSAYNSRTGDSIYKGVLDINKDGIVDIYDLVRVSKGV